MHILFVGAGPSTTTVLVNFLQEIRNRRLLVSNLQITIVEAKSRLGPGLAYNSCEPYHLFNSRANQVGILNGDRKHFFKWIMQNKQKWKPFFPNYDDRFIRSYSFVPRGIYGIYLEEFFTTSLEGLKENGVTVNTVTGRATEGLQLGKKGYVKIKRSDNVDMTLQADKVVLGIGNPPPTPIKNLKDNPKYIHNFWPTDSWHIPRDAPVAIIGVGLTGMDAILTMQARGHKGPITLISRHGQKARIHGPVLPLYKREIFTLNNVKKLNPPTAEAYFSMLSQEIAAAKEKGYNWRCVIDSLRENSQTYLQSGPLSKQVGFKTFWKLLSNDEKIYWNKKYDSQFNTLRFRLPPESWERIEPLFTSGQAKIIQADITDNSFKAQPDTYYINCTGPDLEQNQFVKSLFAKGICQRHPAGGLSADQNMYLIGSNKKPSQIFSAIGPVRKGEDFETVAMVEIVDQTLPLINSLIKELEEEKTSTNITSRL